MKKRNTLIAAALAFAVLTVAFMISYEGSDDSEAMIGETFWAPNDDGVQLRYSILSETDAGGTVSLIQGPADDAYGLSVPSSATMPSTGKTFEVVSIGTRAFDSNQKIHGNVAISSSVMEIRGYAFSRCTNITSVSIPDSVKTLGEFAFERCTSMTSCRISTAITAINPATFLGCTALTSVSVPDSVVSIESSAFDGCTSLAAVSGCAGVELIKDNAFLNCSSLVSLSFGNKLVRISYGAFLNCASLVSAVLPDTVEEIGDSTFKNCTSLTNVRIPAKVTVLEEELFAGCVSLSDIQIPNGVLDIREGAFQNSGIRSLVLPASVKTIERKAFCGCTQLEEASLIRTVIEEIGTEAFMDCPSLRTVTLPDELRTVGDNAFANTLLSGAEIKSNVTSIGIRSFANCPLMYISFPAGLESVGDDAFAGRQFKDSAGTVIDPTAPNLRNRAFAYTGGYMQMDAFTVNYRIEGEQYGETEIYRAGTQVTLRADPVREGYSFSGWSSYDIEIAGVFSMPASNVTIRGHWIEFKGAEDVVVEGNTAKISSDAEAVVLNPEASRKMAESGSVEISLGSIGIDMKSSTFRSYAQGEEFAIQAASDEYHGPAKGPEKKILESSVAYEVIVQSSGKGGPRGIINYSFPYTPSDDSLIRVYCTDGQGNFHEIPYRYSNGMVEFSYDSFGYFVIAEGSLGHDTDSKMPVTVIAAAYAAAMTAFVIYYARKR